MAMNFSTSFPFAFQVIVPLIFSNQNFVLISCFVLFNLLKLGVNVGYIMLMKSISTSNRTHWGFLKTTC